MANAKPKSVRKQPVKKSPKTKSAFMDKVWRNVLVLVIIVTAVNGYLSYTLLQASAARAIRVEEQMEFLNKLYAELQNNTAQNAQIIQMLKDHVYGHAQ